jgi:hypothetical protein
MEEAVILGNADLDPYYFTLQELLDLCSWLNDDSYAQYSHFSISSGVLYAIPPRRDQTS